MTRIGMLYYHPDKVRAKEKSRIKEKEKNKKYLV